LGRKARRLSREGVVVTLREAIGRLSIPRYAIMLAGTALNGVVGVADLLTGHELALSVFYVIPVALVTWSAGLGLGIATSVISSGIWVTAEIADGQYSSPFMLVWNALIRLAFFLIITYLLAALRKAMRRLEESSYVDNLTGAANSAFFYDSLGKELDRLGRYGRPLTLAYMDLDGFKSVNDEFGHRMRARAT
jgi:predicted signal transduction protein with EAL and GGDEF domain